MNNTKAGIGSTEALIATLLISAALLSFGFFSNKATVLFIAEGNRFLQLGEEFTVIITAESSKPFNAVAGLVRFPQDRAEVTHISKEGSAIDLWVKEPALAGEGAVEFAGGIIEGARGRRDIFAVTFKSTAVGEIVIDYAEASVLAHDGIGTEILGKQRDIAYHIREPGAHTFDYNDNNVVNLSDLFGLLREKKIGIRDLSILFELLYR